MFTRRVLIMVFPVLSGCDYVASEAADTLYAGTVKGVEFCMSRNESDLVHDFVIRNLCVTKHERSIFVELSGSALFRPGLDSPYFSGNIGNESANHVVTGFTVTIEYGDSLEDTKAFSGLWIEPDESSSFSIPSDELTAEIDRGPLSIDDFDWNVTKVYGLKIAIN